MGHHGKKPKQRVSPQPSKEAKNLPPGDTEKQTIAWSFTRFDGLLWHDNQYAPSPFNEIGNHMRSYESMTWGELRRRGDRDHAVSVDQLIPAAQKRLRELHFDDCDELWRFRFSGQKRVWGVRIGQVFKALWWDPQHKICPSPKKNT